MVRKATKKYSFDYKHLWHLFLLEDDLFLMLVRGENLSPLQTGVGTGG